MKTAIRALLRDGQGRKQRILRESFYHIQEFQAERRGYAFWHNPKASVCYFSGGDSVTLIGNVEFIRIVRFRKTSGTMPTTAFSARELMIRSYQDNWADSRWAFSLFDIYENDFN
jgi:hypothetical protein